MNDSKELRTLSENFSRLEGMLEAKLDNLIEEIRELKEADQSLHTRISEKTKEVRDLTNRVTKLETGVLAIKYACAAIVGIGTVVGTYLAGWWSK